MTTAPGGPAIGASGQKIVLIPAASPAVAPVPAVVDRHRVRGIDAGQPCGAQEGLGMRLAFAHVVAADRLHAGIDQADRAQIGVDDQPVGIGHHRLLHAKRAQFVEDLDRAGARLQRCGHRQIVIVFAHDPVVERQVEAELVAQHLVDRPGGDAEHPLMQVGRRRDADAAQRRHQGCLVQRLAVDQRAVHVPENRFRRHARLLLPIPLKGLHREINRRTRLSGDVGGSDCRSSPVADAASNCPADRQLRAGAFPARL